MFGRKRDLLVKGVRSSLTARVVEAQISSVQKDTEEIESYIADFLVARDLQWLDVQRRSYDALAR